MIVILYYITIISYIVYIYILYNIVYINLYTYIYTYKYIYSFIYNLRSVSIGSAWHLVQVLLLRENWTHLYSLQLPNCSFRLKPQSMWSSAKRWAIPRCWGVQTTHLQASQCGRAHWRSECARFHQILLHICKLLLSSRAVTTSVWMAPGHHSPTGQDRSKCKVSLLNQLDTFELSPL